MKTCLAKGCYATGLGLYFRYHMPCKFKSMTFPFSRKLPALLVPSTIRLTQCWQKEGMMQWTFATTAALCFLPFGALWRLSLDWWQVLARSNAAQQQARTGFDQGLHTIKINIDLHRPETLTNPLCNHLTTCHVFCCCNCASLRSLHSCLPDLKQTQKSGSNIQKKGTVVPAGMTK